jgi:uncharacterized protein YjbI with pentapeptide repeats
MTKEEIAAVLAEHKAWLESKGGKRANLAGANLFCARLDGANLARARLDGANLAGANLAGANLACANLDGANLFCARLDGANLARAYLDGAKINDKTIIGILRRATRSDGYEFFLWHCREGYFIKAGCRFLDMEAARQHWTNTRQGTSLGYESLDILDFFDAAIKRQGGAA